MNEYYLSVSEVAAELELSSASIYKIINHADPSKRLEPVNRSTYKGDGGYRFRCEDVARIKDKYVKTDLTSSQVAALIGRSKSFVQKLLKDGIIPYYIGELRGRKTFFIKEEHLKEYSSKHPDYGKYDTIFDKKLGVFLFQPYIKDNEVARVIEMKRVSRYRLEIVLQTESKNCFTYEQALSDGWQPVIQITPKKPNSAYGHARFEFPNPTTNDSMTYTIVEEFFKQIGPSNMRITTGEKLIIEVKKSVLFGVLPTTHPDLVDKLKMFIVQGEIVSKFDGVLIDTDLSPITFYLPESKKIELIKEAENEGKSIQEWLESKFS